MTDDRIENPSASQFAFSGPLSSRPVPVLFGILVCLSIMTIGVLVRVAIVYGQQETVWLDELHTAWAISGSFADVWPRAMAGNQSPAFFWIEYLAISNGRLTGAELRTPTFVIGLLLIASTAYVVRQLTCDWTCTAVALVVVCCDYYFIYYGTEARPYCAVQFTALWQVYFFWKCWVKKDVSMSTLFGLVGMTITMFFMHYTSLMLVFAEVVFVGVAVICSKAMSRWPKGTTKAVPTNGSSKKTPHRALLICFLIALLFALPGVWQLIGIGSNREMWSSFADGKNLLAQLRSVVLCYFFVPAIFLTLCWLAQSINPSAGRIIKLDRPTGMLLVFVVFVPILAALIISGVPFGESGNAIAALGHIRYVIAATAIVPLLMAWTTKCFVNPTARIGFAFVFSSIAITANPMMYELMMNGDLPRLRKERWDMVLTQIDTTRGQDYPVFLCSNIIEDQKLTESANVALQEYCKFPLNNQLYQLHRAEDLLIPLPTFSQTRFRKEFLSLLRDSPGAYLVIRGHQELLDDVYSEFTLFLRRANYVVTFEQLYTPKNSNLFLIQFKFDLVNE